MHYRQFLAGLVASGFLVGAAHAQSGLVEVRDRAQVAAFGASADDVDDWDVFDAAGTEIGEVEEVVGTDRDTPTALVVDFEGNAGYADRDVVIPLDQFTHANGRLTLNASPDAVSALPTWND